MDIQSFINHYLQYCEVLNDSGETQESRYLETRTREGDVTDALRFRVFDPLWMLSRQWQLGEFRGNDAGTAMNVNCKVKSTPISKYSLGKDGFTARADADQPLEPFVERIERTITPLVRVESASYFMDLVYDCDEIQDKKSVLNRLCTLEELLLEGTRQEHVRHDGLHHITACIGNLGIAIHHGATVIDGVLLAVILEAGHAAAALVRRQRGLPQFFGRTLVNTERLRRVVQIQSAGRLQHHVGHAVRRVVSFLIHAAHGHQLTRGVAGAGLRRAGRPGSPCSARRRRCARP